MRPLAVRLAYWARENGWGLTYAVGRDEFTQRRFVLAKIGPYGARGRTAGHATDELANMLAQAGVRDDDRGRVAA